MLIDATEVLVDGDGSEALVMVHGWPDTAGLWDAQVAHFRSQFRCVRFTLPGFDLTQPRRGRSLDELVDFLRRVVEATSPGRPVTLMLHDWGCFFGFELARRHPDLVRRIVAVDVGDAHTAEFRSSLSVAGALSIAGYQWWLVLAWRLGGWWPRIGDGMTRWMARSMGCRSDPARIGACMNYPYDITWTGSHGGYRKLPALAPHCPLFYAWARRKPAMFHSPAWLARMASVPGHQVQAFDCGHWVMRQRADSFNQSVAAWFGAVAPATPAAG